MEYHVTLPYPKIKVESKNIAYANLILLNFAGYTSELSAVTQYVYHQISFADFFACQPTICTISVTTSSASTPAASLATIMAGMWLASNAMVNAR